MLASRRRLLLEGRVPSALERFALGEADGKFALFNTAQPAAGTKVNGALTLQQLAAFLTIAVGSQKLVRNRVGTYEWVAAGGVPLEVDSTNKSYQRVEPARTNHLAQPLAPDNAAWTKSNCTVPSPNGVVAPDGTATADQIVFGSATASIRQTGITVNTAGPNSFSAWKKSSSAMSLTQRLTPQGAGSPVSTTQNLTTAWQRFLRQLTGTGGMTSVQAWLLDFTQSFDLWGMQLEHGNQTSFINGSSRVADQISRVASNVPARTIFVDFAVKDTPTAAGVILALSDGTANETISIEYEADADIVAIITVGGVDVATIPAGVKATGGVRRQITLAIEEDNFALSVDGGAPVTAGSGAVPAVDRLTYGALFGTTQFTTEVIDFFRDADVPRRISNADMATWRYSTESGPFKVFGEAGQSNRVGRGDTINPAVDVGGSRFFQWTQSASLARLSPANDPLDHVDQNGKVGNGVAFSRWLDEHWLPAGWNGLLVPRAKGGTSFRTNDWNPGDVVYEAFVQGLLEAIASHPGNELAGILWSLGETDSDFQASVDAFLDKFAAMYADLVARVPQAATARWLIFGMAPDWVALDSKRQQMQAILASLPGSYPNMAYVDPTGLEGNQDGGIHFTAANQRILGYERAAAAWQTLL